MGSEMCIRDSLYPLLMSLFSTATMDSASNFRTFWAEEVKRREKKDMIALRHTSPARAGGGDCAGRSIARWPSFMHMHVSVYLEAESPCQFPVFQTTHFGALALVRLLFHELLGLQLRRLLRWTSIGAREGFYILCSLLLVRSLPMRDRARAMRPARYVGPAGEERF